MSTLDAITLIPSVPDIKDEAYHEDISQLLKKIKELPLPALTSDEIKLIVDFLQKPVARPILKIPSIEKDLYVDMGFDLTLKEVYVLIKTQAKNYGWDSCMIRIVGSKVAALLGVSYFKRAFTAARIDPLTVASEKKWLQFEKKLQDDSDTDIQVYSKLASREQQHDTMLRICNLVAKKFNKLLATDESVKKAHKEIQKIKKRKDLLIPSNYLDVITQQTIKNLGLSDFRISKSAREKPYEVAVLGIGMKKKLDITIIKGTPDPKVDKTHWSDYDSAYIALIEDSTFAIDSFSSYPGSYLISNLDETYTPNKPLDSKDLLRILTKSMKGLSCHSLDCECEAFDRFIYTMEAQAIFYNFIDKKFEDNYCKAIDCVLNLYFTTVRIGKPLLHILHIINPLLFRWKTIVTDPLYKQILNMYTEVSPQEFFSFFQWISLIQNVEKTEGLTHCFKLVLPSGSCCLIPIQPTYLFGSIPISPLLTYVRSFVHITKKISAVREIELLIHKRATALASENNPTIRELALRLLLLITEKNTAPLMADLACVNATPLLTVFPELAHEDRQQSIKKLAVAKDVEKQELAVELLKRYPNQETSLFIFSAFVIEKKPLALRVLPATYSKAWISGIGTILENPGKFSLSDQHPLWERLDAHQIVNLSEIAINNVINRHNRVQATFLSLNILAVVVDRKQKKLIQKSLEENTPVEHKKFVQHEIKSLEEESSYAPMSTHITKKREVAVKNREEPFIARLKYVTYHKYWRDACHVLGSISPSQRSAEVLAPCINEAIEVLEKSYHSDGCKFVIELYKIERYKSAIQSLVITWVTKKGISDFPDLAAMLHILKPCVATSPDIQEFFITTLTSDRNRSHLSEFALPLLASLHKSPDSYIKVYQHYLLTDRRLEVPHLLEVFQALLKIDPYDVRLEGLWSGVVVTITESTLEAWVSAALDKGSFAKTYPIFIKYLTRISKPDSTLIYRFLSDFGSRLTELKDQELADLSEHLSYEDREKLACSILKLTLPNALGIVHKLPQSFVTQQKLISAIITSVEFLSFAQSAKYVELMPHQSLFLADYNVDDEIKVRVAIQFLSNEDAQVQRLGARIVLFSKTSEEPLLRQSLEVIEKTGIEDIAVYATHSPLFQTIKKRSTWLQISIANMYGKALSQVNTKVSKLIEKEYFELLEGITKDCRSSIKLQQTLETYPAPKLYRKAVSWVVESEKKEIGLDVNYMLTHFPEIEHTDPDLIRQLSTLFKDERVKEKEKAAICLLKAFSDISISNVTPLFAMYLLNHIQDWSISVAIYWVKKIISAENNETMQLQFFNKILSSKAQAELSILQPICSKMLATDIDRVLSPNFINFLKALEDTLYKNKKILKNGQSRELTSIKHFKKFKAVFDYVFTQQPFGVCLRKWEKISPSKDPVENFLEFQKEVLIYLRKETFDSHKRTQHFIKIIKELFETTTELEADGDLIYEAVQDITVTSIFIGPGAEEYVYESLLELIEDDFFSSDKEGSKKDKKSIDRVLSLLMYAGTINSVAEYTRSLPVACVTRYIKAFEKIFADPKKKIGLNKLAIANLIDRYSELSEIIPDLDTKIFSHEIDAYYDIAKRINSQVMEYIKSCGFPEIEEDKSTPKKPMDRVSCYAHQYIMPCVRTLSSAVADLMKKIPLARKIQLCKALYIATQSIAFIETNSPYIYFIFKLRAAMVRGIFASPEWLDLLKSIQLLECTEKESYTGSKEEAILEFSKKYFDSMGSIIERFPEVAVELVKNWIDSIPLAKEGMSNWKEVKYKVSIMATDLFSKKTSLAKKDQLLSKLSGFFLDENQE